MNKLILSIAIVIMSEQVVFAGSFDPKDDPHLMSCKNGGSNTEATPATRDNPLYACKGPLTKYNNINEISVGGSNPSLAPAETTGGADRPSPPGN